ncbi:ATP8B2 [Symbiodinium sp. CCMP2592]|nr:ATP8B2 [Symbiodinium sp. CCMP2592]
MFAKQGLRTLVLGRCGLSLADGIGRNWEAPRFLSLREDREAALAAVAARIESSLEIVGVTAIEDKLQVGVQDAIVKIRQAGIKLWVLTGDKLETAKNIGFSTRVLSQDLRAESAEGPRAQTGEKLRELSLRGSGQAAAARRTLALIVTGHALEAASAHLGPEAFSLSRRRSGSGVAEAAVNTQVAMLCSVVIACRVSPLQKAEIVKIVRRGVHPTPVTLAIGDGANDVPMLQQAQVGVGISGREGNYTHMQRARLYAITLCQRYLVRAVLVSDVGSDRGKFVIYRVYSGCSPGECWRPRVASDFDYGDSGWLMLARWCWLPFVAFDFEFVGALRGVAKGLCNHLLVPVLVERRLDGSAVACGQFAHCLNEVLLMFYYTFFSGYAGQSLFEDMVRASYNFVLAFPIITTGMFEQDLEEEQVLANPGLYVNGREGLDLNASKLVEMLLSAAVHSCVIGVVMLLVCHDMYVLQAGDFYTFGTIVFTVLVIAMNYRAAFLTRTWNVVTVAGQLCSFLIYARLVCRIHRLCCLRHVFVWCVLGVISPRSR